jgi:hypothetical protein
VDPDLIMEDHAYSQSKPVRNVAAHLSTRIAEFSMVSEESERDQSAVIRVKDWDLA